MFQEAVGGRYKKYKKKVSNPVREFVQIQMRKM